MSKAEKQAVKLRQEEEHKKRQLEEKLHKEEMAKSEEKQKKDPKGTQLKNLVKRCNIVMSQTPVVSMTTSLIYLCTIFIIFIQRSHVKCICLILNFCFFQM